MARRLKTRKDMSAGPAWRDDQSAGVTDPLVHLGESIVRQAIKDVRGPSLFIALDAFAWLLSDEVEDWLCAMGFAVQPADVFLTLTGTKGAKSMLNEAIHDAVNEMDRGMRNRFKRTLAREFPVFIRTVADQVRAGYMIDDAPKILAAGNGVGGDIPKESFKK